MVEDGAEPYVGKSRDREKDTFVALEEPGGACRCPVRRRQTKLPAFCTASTQAGVRRR
jgi:hypothetical protein